MDQNVPANTITLTQDELSYLMHLSGTKALLGLDPAVFPASDLDKGRRTLVAQKLIQPGKPGSSDQVLGSLLQVLYPVFSPHRALMIVRNLPEQGIQTLVLYASKGNFTLHTMPETDRHQFTVLPSAREIYGPVLDWFKIDGIPGVPGSTLWSPSLLTRFQEKAEAGQDEEALQAIQEIPMESGEKLALVHAFQNAVVSGSFALISFEESSQINLETMAILSDLKTAWAITVPDQDSSQYRVRRTGDDFPGIVSRMLDWVEAKI